MTRKIVAALLLALLATSGARAQAPAFNPAQRAEIVAIVRDALKSDPTILRDAVTALQADEGVRHDAAARAAIGAARTQLAGQSSDPIAGNPAGDVTLVEFYDVRCPYCRQMVPVFDQLLAQDHNVRLVLKDLPILGPASVLGAKALLAAQRQGGYLRLQAALMSGPPDITEAALRSQAIALGLDWGRLQRDMGDSAIQQRIDANLALAHALNIDGTPAIVVGERVLPGAVDLAQLRTIVAQARQ